PSPARHTPPPAAAPTPNTSPCANTTTVTASAPSPHHENHTDHRRPTLGGRRIRPASGRERSAAVDHLSGDADVLVEHVSGVCVECGFGHSRHRVGHHVGRHVVGRGLVQLDRDQLGHPVTVGGFVLHHGFLRKLFVEVP